MARSALHHAHFAIATRHCAMQRTALQWGDATHCVTMG